jgi:hypothetical protein
MRRRVYPKPEVNGCGIAGHSAGLTLADISFKNDSLTNSYRYEICHNQNRW